MPAAMAAPALRASWPRPEKTLPATAVMPSSALFAPSPSPEKRSASPGNMAAALSPRAENGAVSMDVRRLAMPPDAPSTVLCALSMPFLSASSVWSPRDATLLSKSLVSPSISNTTLPSAIVPTIRPLCGR